MTRGRKPLPTAILKRRGSKRAKYERPANEPKPELGCPECPAELSEEAKAEWDRVAPELARLGVLTLIDRGLLAGYCQAWGDFIAARKLIDKDGVTIPRPGEGGGVMKNPAFTVLHESRMALLRFGQEFGLSASSRARINVKPREPEEQTGVGKFLPSDNMRIAK